MPQRCRAHHQLFCDKTPWENKSFSVVFMLNLWFNAVWHIHNGFTIRPLGWTNGFALMFIPKLCSNVIGHINCFAIRRPGGTNDSLECSYQIYTPTPENLLYHYYIVSHVNVCGPKQKKIFSFVNCVKIARAVMKGAYIMMTPK